MSNPLSKESKRTAKWKQTLPLCSLKHPWWLRIKDGTCVGQGHPEGGEKTEEAV